jgi:hypothetical protein
MTTMKPTVRRPLTTSPRHHLAWLRSATVRPRAALRHVRITGQLGGYDDHAAARRTGARF